MYDIVTKTIGRPFHGMLTLRVQYIHDYDGVDVLLDHIRRCIDSRLVCLSSTDDPVQKEKDRRINASGSEYVDYYDLELDFDILAELVKAINSVPEAVDVQDIRLMPVDISFQY